MRTKSITNRSAGIVVCVSFFIANAGCKPPDSPVSQQPQSKTKATTSEDRKEEPASSSTSKSIPETSESKSPGDAGATGSPPAAPGEGKEPSSKVQPFSGSQSGSAGSGEASPKPEDPKQAAKEAGELFKVAKQEKDRGDDAEAYQSAVRAWELASAFPQDKACSSLVEELEPFIEQQASAVNRKAGAANGSRRVGKKIVIQ